MGDLFAWKLDFFCLPPVQLLKTLFVAGRFPDCSFRKREKRAIKKSHRQAALNFCSEVFFVCTPKINIKQSCSLFCCFFGIPISADSCLRARHKINHINDGKNTLRMLINENKVWASTQEKEAGMRKIKWFKFSFEEIFSSSTQELRDQ